MADNPKERVKELLLKYPDATHDEFGNWCPPLEAELFKLYSTHGPKLITVLKDCIFELDNDLKSIDILFADTFNSDRFTCKETYDAMLEIFDSHENKITRMSALHILKNINYDSLEDLERRYESEKNMQVREKMGGIILYKLLLKMELPDYHGISGSVYNGGKERFAYIFERIPKDKVINELELLTFLRDSKYISNQMRSYMEYLLEKIGGQNV